MVRWCVVRYVRLLRKGIGLRRPIGFHSSSNRSVVIEWLFSHSWLSFSLLASYPRMPPAVYKPRVLCHLLPQSSSTSLTHSPPSHTQSYNGPHP